MKERQRDARGFRFLTGWRMDLALAIRMTVRHKALSAIAIFGITVAIAVSATMFTLVGEQLNPSDLPLPDGRRIVSLQQWDSSSNLPQPLAAPDIVAWREQLSAVRSLGGAWRNPGPDEEGGEGDVEKRADQCGSRSVSDE